MKENAKIGIVIINWNNYEDTSECLQSVFNFENSNLLVVVVDNGSTDNSYQQLRQQFPTVTFIPSPVNLGFGRGNNLGIKHCMKEGVDYVLLLNDDVVCPPNFISVFLDHFVSDRQLGIVGPKVCYYDRPDTIWAAGGYILWLRGAFGGIGMNEKDEGQYNQMAIVDYVPGAAMMVSSEVFNKIGMFPECYFLAGEEVDLAVNAKNAGYKVLYTPRVSCLHKVGYSRQSDFPMIYNRFRNSLLFVDRHVPVSLRWLWMAYQMLYLGAKKIAGILKGNRMMMMLPTLFRMARTDHKRYDSVQPEHLDDVRNRLEAMRRGSA